MVRTETVKEYCLAYVYIKAGATAITAADIEDTRANESLCGWVTGLIEQLSSKTLFEQFKAIFDEWFNSLQDLINTDTETMLVAALPVSITVTLPASGWVAGSGGYTCEATVIGMTATKTVMVQPTTDSVTKYSAAEIRCTAQGVNKLTFSAVTAPTEEVKVSVVHMGV